ncbi:hypothetical protein Tsubulata_014516, partial [Turnera subulata]
RSVNCFQQRIATVVSGGTRASIKWLEVVLGDPSRALLLWGRTAVTAAVSGGHVTPAAFLSSDPALVWSCFLRSSSRQGRKQQPCTIDCKGARSLRVPLLQPFTGANEVSLNGPTPESPSFIDCRLDPLDPRAILCFSTGSYSENGSHGQWQSLSLSVV